MVDSRTGVLRAIVITMALSAIGLVTWLTRTYQNTCPTEPNEQAGAVFPLDDHGRIVYLTLAEHKRVIAGETCFITLWISVLVVEIMHRRQLRARN